MTVLKQEAEKCTTLSHTKRRLEETKQKFEQNPPETPAVYEQLRSQNPPTAPDQSAQFGLFIYLIKYICDRRVLGKGKKMSN